MSQENVEVVQAAYDAWNAGDMDALGELYDAEAVTRPLESWPEQATAVGREAVMRVWKQLRETFDADAAETVSVVEVGDRVAVRTIWHGTGHGPETAFEMTMIYTVRNRRIFYLESFWDHAEALETLGLSVEEMSKENVEVVRQLYEAFNEGTMDLDLWHTDAELRPALIGGGLLEGAVYRGHEGVSEFVALQGETWESVVAKPVEIRDLGRYLLVETRLQAVGRASGIELSDVTWNMFEIRDGKVANWRVFTEKQQALEALGLEE
jgi:ketosteroid isomerase-like protein